MPKAKIKKRSVTKKRSYSSTGRTDINDVLVENFISLQNVMTNLTLKFDGLSSQIAKLLELFEVSAKSLAEKDFESDKGNENSKEIIEKLDNLITQNKTIARGLTLMHEGDSERKLQPPRPRPLQFQGQRPSAGVNEYQKSISLRDDTPKP